MGEAAFFVGSETGAGAAVRGRGVRKSCAIGPVRGSLGTVMPPRADDFWNEKKPRYRKYRGIRDRALADFRGFWEPDDTEAFAHDEIGDVVASTLKRLGLKQRFDEDQVKAAWHEVVGDFVSRNSQPIGVQRKVLLVQVLQPAVHYTLERMKGQILERMQARFGKEHIREVRFRIG